MTTTTTRLSAQAAAITDPDVAGAPEHPEDLRTVEQVDWQGLVVAALGPTTSVDLPLPQLLLRLGAVLSEVAGNAEHLKSFVGGTSRDQEDLAGSVAAALKRNAQKVSDQADQIVALTMRVEQLEVAREQAKADLADAYATAQR